MPILTTTQCSIKAWKRKSGILITNENIDNGAYWLQGILAYSVTQ